ncbi:hypothetical protein D3C76_1205640 [compost metagenome]
MLHEHARDIAQLHGLVGQGEGAGNHCLGGDHRGQGGQQHHGQQRPARRQQVEGVTCGGGVGEDRRALAEVVQHQARQDQEEPGAGDGFAAEVAHVGVERLGPGQGQHHRPENGDADARMNDEEMHAPIGVERLEHLGLLDDAVDPESAQHAEPEHHDWPEQDADARGAVLLDQEQPHQHDQRQRHDPVADAVERQVQAFDGREHRDGRSDHAVAIEQGGAEQAE